MTRTLAALLLAMPAYAVDLTATDGDTLRFATERLRLEGIDTPELRCRCPSECDAARAAQEALQALLDGAGSVVVVRTGIDRYGRSLGRVEVNGVDVGEAMVEAGLARRWTGRRELWC